MARITIEDCIEKVPNRFHLVQMAAIRAKQLKLGANSMVTGDGNKSVVLALREIAAGHILPDYPDEPEERPDWMPAAATEEAVAAAAEEAVADEAAAPTK